MQEKLIVLFPFRNTDPVSYKRIASRYRLPESSRVAERYKRSFSREKVRFYSSSTLADSQARGILTSYGFKKPLFAKTT